MSEMISLDIFNFIITKPEIIWSIAFIGAVCVVGVVDYLRCFFEKKKSAIRWVVLILSLFVAIIFSPLVPKVITTIIVIWLLILSLSTIAKKTIIDGMLAMINRITGAANNKDGK